MRSVMNRKIGAAAISAAALAMVFSGCGKSEHGLNPDHPVTVSYTHLDVYKRQVASTMAFATLTLARLFHGFNCRSEHSIFRLGFKGNWYSLGAFAAGALLLACVIFLPFLHGLFEVADLTGAQMGLVLLLAVIPTAVIQLVKFVKEH